MSRVAIVAAFSCILLTSSISTIAAEKPVKAKKPADITFRHVQTKNGTEVEFNLNGMTFIAPRVAVLMAAGAEPIAQIRVTNGLLDSDSFLLADEITIGFDDDGCAYSDIVRLDAPRPH